MVVRAVAHRFAAVGAELTPVRATCYLYPDFEPLRDHLSRAHGVDGGGALAALFSERYGVGLLPGTAFGEPGSSLRVRAATSRLYGETEADTRSSLPMGDTVCVTAIQA